MYWRNIRSNMGWLLFAVLCWLIPPGLPKATLPDNDELTLSQRRYEKGLELIRLLYEKILSLDHHFSAMHTDQWVQTLSNPMSYPGFSHYFQQGTDRQSSPIFLLAGLENPHLASSYAFANLYTDAGLSSDTRSQLLCLLDFVLRIYPDLHLIYYETDFLIQCNIQLQRECRELFEDYTKVINYHHSLDHCRNSDDWEAVSKALGTFIQSMRQKMDDGIPNSRQQLLRDHINLEFSVDRLLNFLRNYQVHIQQGGRYYQKFQLILAHHTPNTICVKEMPEAWVHLEREVAQAVVSFNQAYQVPEFKGSQLKDLLYGFSE